MGDHRAIATAGFCPTVASRDCAANPEPWIVRGGWKRFGGARLRARENAARHAIEFAARVHMSKGKRNCPFVGPFPTESHCTACSTSEPRVLPEGGAWRAATASKTLTRRVSGYVVHKCELRTHPAFRRTFWQQHRNETCVCLIPVLRKDLLRVSNRLTVLLIRRLNVQL